MITPQMIQNYDKDVKNNIKDLNVQNLGEFGAVPHMYQRKIQNPSLNYPPRFNNNDISGITEELQMTLAH